MSNNLFKWIIGIIASIVIIVGIDLVILISHTPNNKDNYSFLINRDNIELIYDGARADLVQCIDSTIRVYAPTTCMNGLEILRQCEKYDVDIFFVLAQGHLESHFGTRGMALRTNSVFNVLAYDDKSYDAICSNGKYKHPDLSLVPYLKLLKSRYLIDGKTETDLMVNYVDVDGHRYASSKEYEVNLTNMYHKYISNEQLISCYKQYTKYKILAGK